MKKMLLLALWFVACHGNRLNVTGVVQQHGHRSAYVTSTVICTGKPMICRPVITPHPERWWLTLRVGQENVDIDVDSTKFTQVQDGQTVPVTYTTGAYGGYELQARIAL